MNKIAGFRIYHERSDRYQSVPDSGWKFRVDPGGGRYRLPFRLRDQKPEAVKRHGDIALVENDCNQDRGRVRNGSQLGRERRRDGGEKRPGYKGWTGQHQMGGVNQLRPDRDLPARSVFLNVLRFCVDYTSVGTNGRCEPVR